MSRVPSFTPKPLFSCSSKGCADEASYPPEMLWWVTGAQLEKWLAESITTDPLGSGWFCENCLWWWAADDWSMGAVVRLDRWMEGRRVAVECTCGRVPADRALADGECACGRGMRSEEHDDLCRSCWIETGLAEAADLNVKYSKENDSGC